LDHPFYNRAPWCRFPTIKACDENWTQFQHGHLGRPCVKQYQPSKTKRGATNSIATCVIIDHAEVGESFKQNLDRQLAAAPPSYNESLARKGT
jgi:hypothetical protein